ncbi:MAG: hypothetical protein WAR37_00955 [Candidatus Microsaccharimonas sp.]
MEKLEIQPNDSVSINDLTGLQKQGFSVMRSAHVGNLSPYNLTLAASGIRMLLVDHNVTGVDKNYFPEKQLSQGSIVELADDGLVVSRAVTSNGFLDEVHINAIKQALPEANVFTNTEYLQTNAAIASEITALALAYKPELFERIVKADGTTAQVPNGADLVDKFGVLQLANNPRAEKTAVIMPNLLDILINFVVEALESEQETQYHISGPDMIRYINSLQKDLQDLYQIVRNNASFGSLLPSQLNVQLVPASDARFATTLSYEKELQAVFDELDAAVIAQSALNARRKNFFSQQSQTDDARQRFIATSNTDKLTIERKLVQQTERVPGLFTPPRQPGFITQYDVVNDGLAIAPANITKPLGELSTITKELTALRKRVTP